MIGKYRWKLKSFSISRLFIFLIFFVPISLTLIKINEDCSSVDNSTWWSIFKYTWISNDVVVPKIIWYKLIALIALSLVLTFVLYKIICKVFRIQSEKWNYDIIKTKKNGLWKL